ncbi:unnamed protein product [Danaus chrysippus]|uniref:(African queen) hypothetical protein n=1 Tax=Danaus chrysippus TaxID=151541 RepID=A0A8J2QF27_9NEOP|nr:unnamed protein product [Danaus chrysippus]
MISESLYSIHEPHTHVEDDKVKGASNRGWGLSRVWRPGVRVAGRGAGGGGAGAVGLSLFICNRYRGIARPWPCGHRSGRAPDSQP